MAGKKGRSGRGPAEKRTISDKTKKAIQKAVKELTEEYGMSPEKAALKMLYMDNIMPTAKASILKSYLEAMTVKETDSSISVKEGSGLVIGLPELYKDE